MILSARPHMEQSLQRHSYSMAFFVSMNYMVLHQDKMDGLIGVIMYGL